jgi:hypothetical protein
VNSLRFHVLALVCVAAAVLLGALVGGAVRTHPTVVGSDQTAALQARNEALQAQLRQLAASPSPSPTVTGADDVVDQLAPAVLDQRLNGVSVLILSASGGASAVPGVARMLDLAGASMVGRLQLTDAFDPGHTTDLLDLATAPLPPSLRTSVKTSAPGQSDGVTLASALLAKVLYTPTVRPEDRRSVLAAFANHGYLTGVDTVSGSAQAVVLVTGGPGGPTDALLTLVAQLHHAGPVVVGADASQSTVVGRVRTDSELSGSVSTVDDIGAQAGQLVCAWALADELSGHTGAYGHGTLPPLVSARPSPTPSRTSSAAPTRTA